MLRFYGFKRNVFPFSGVNDLQGFYSAGEIIFFCSFSTFLYQRVSHNFTKQSSRTSVYILFPDSL